MSQKQKTTEFSSKIPVELFRLCSIKLRGTKILDGNMLRGNLVYRRWGVRKVEEAVVIQLNGIRSPELHIQQAGTEPDDFAIEAIQYLKQQIEGKRVKVVIARKHNGELIQKNYNSEHSKPALLAFIHPTFWGIKQDALNVRLVRKGLAWRSNKSEWMTKKYHQQLSKAEKKAKKRRINLWRNCEPERESRSLNFWVGLLVGILVGFAMCLLWTFYRLSDK